MSIRVSASNLSQSAKQLAAEWQQAKQSWHDVKSQEFEETYLEILPHAISRATIVIEELDKILRKVRSDCE
jgi:hypothetical protein